MRKMFLVLGAVLAFVFGIGIFLFLQFTRPIVVEVPVAASDIPAGTVLRANLFRAAQFANADPQTVAQWVTVNTWNTADGKVTNSDIRAGFPIAKTQIDPNLTSQVSSRLSMALTDTNQYYVVLPVKADDVGNFIQPGDRIDIILNIGSISAKDVLTTTTESQNTDRQNAGNGTAPTSTNSDALLPISKLVMQNLTILRIERNTPSSSSASQQNQGTQQAQPTPQPVSDVKRLYVRVDRDQLEVLSFVMNNSKNNYAVRAANASQESLPTDGVTWGDFVRWFYAQRGNDVNSAQPFNAISPSEKPAGR